MRVGHPLVLPPLRGGEHEGGPSPLDDFLRRTTFKYAATALPAGDHKAQINRHAQMHNKHKTEEHKWSIKEVPPLNGQ